MDLWLKYFIQKEISRAKKMKIFQIIQKQYAILGISSPNQSAQKNPSNERTTLGFLIFAWNIVSQFVYIFYVASGFMEYVDCISSTCAGIITFVCFAAIVFRKTTLFKNIENMEQLIDKSESFLNRYSWFEWNSIHMKICFRMQISEITEILLKNQSASRTI